MYYHTCSHLYPYLLPHAVSSSAPLLTAVHSSSWAQLAQAPSGPWLTAWAAPAAALMVGISSNSLQLGSPLTAPWRGTAPGFLTALLGLWEAVPGIFSWVSCVLQAVKEEVQVLPGSHAAHCLGNRKLVLPFSSSLCFINCTDPRGGCQGSCHFPGCPCVQTQSFVPKSQGPFYTSLPILQVAEYRTFPSECPGLPLPSPFLLTYPAPAQPTHRPRKALCFLNTPPSQKQTFTHSSQTHRQGLNPCALQKSLHLWQGITCSAWEQQANEKGSSNCWMKALCKKQPSQRNVKMPEKPSTKPPELDRRAADLLPASRGLCQPLWGSRQGPAGCAAQPAAQPPAWQSGLGPFGSTGTLPPSGVCAIFWNWKPIRAFCLPCLG